MQGRTARLLLFLALIGLITGCMRGADPGTLAGESTPLSDHFDGRRFFNPVGRATPPSPPAGEPGSRRSSWIGRLLFGNDWPEWPQMPGGPPGEPPAVRVPKSWLLLTPIGHATALIQLDGVNILTDPIWSERCSPVSWAGPKRHREPGVRFEDLPPIDAVLVSHNHYDHLDRPTLKRLALKGARRAVTPLGNGDLIRGSGIAEVAELDWWQSVRLSADVTVTLVPAQHFSSRTLWDRNEALWGGFVVSGPAGNVYFSGDTGYGPHFREIGRRFGPIQVAILPISPFRPPYSKGPPHRHYPEIHMGPAQAVQAHLDLGAGLSLAAHYQVFQLGADGFDDAVTELKSALAQRGLKSNEFITPPLGRALDLTARSVPGDALTDRGKADANP